MSAIRRTNEDVVSKFLWRSREPIAEIRLNRGMPYLRLKAIDRAYVKASHIMDGLCFSRDYFGVRYGLSESAR